MRSKGQVQDPGLSLSFQVRGPGPEFENKVLKSTTFKVKVQVQDPCPSPETKSNISIQDQMQIHTPRSGQRADPSLKGSVFKSEVQDTVLISKPMSKDQV